MKKLLFLDEMVTPKIVTLIYWLILLGTIVSGVLAMSNSFLFGLGIIVGGAIGARIWSEVMIVLFKIHENLHKIANKHEV